MFSVAACTDKRHDSFDVLKIYKICSNKKFKIQHIVQINHKQDKILVELN